jgi:hypothetical protein
MFVTVRRALPCLCRTPSLTRGRVFRLPVRVCNLYFFKIFRVATCCVSYYDLFVIAVNRSNVLIVFIFSFSFYTPLHISSLMGHLQVEYTQSIMEASIPITDPFLGYTIYTYISFSFILRYTLFLYLKLELQITY